jgi:hypothetical protein
VDETEGERLQRVRGILKESVGHFKHECQNINSYAEIRCALRLIVEILLGRETEINGQSSPMSNAKPENSPKN